MFKLNSLRTKFVIALVALPTVALLIFLRIAVGVFHDDKIAYIFESSSSLSSALAPQVRSEFSRIETIAAAFVANLQPDGTLSENGRAMFDAASGIRAYKLIVKDAAGVRTQVELQKEQKVAPSADDSDLTAAPDSSFPLVMKGDYQAGLIRIAYLMKGENQTLIGVVSVLPEMLGKGFSETSAQKAFLMLADGKVLLPFSAAAEDFVHSVVQGPLVNAVQLNASGVEQATSAQGERELVSYADVGVAGLKVIAIADEKAALSAVNVLVRKTSAWFAIMIAAIVMFGIFASKALTSALDFLTKAAGKVAAGDFTIRVDVDSNDEIGELASGFNRMAGEVARLLEETSVKARMAHELETARIVQESLLPPNDAVLGSVKLAGFYEPASECGGDWWHYSEDLRFAYVWIGDATGHGVPAALFTSAARAAVAVIQQTDGLEPEICMKLLNSALYQTGKGKMMMTIFLARIDKSSGEVLYSNASHEPPYYLRGEVKDVTKESLIRIEENNNPRLGEYPSYQFTQAGFQLAPGDRLVLYTDGVYDYRNGEGKQLGHRRFTTILVESLNNSTVPAKSLKKAIDGCNQWRSGNGLDDDVTMVIIEFSASAVAAARISA